MAQPGKARAWKARGDFASGVRISLSAPLYYHFAIQHPLSIRCKYQNNRMRMSQVSFCEGHHMQICRYESPIGTIVLTGSKMNLRGLWFEEQVPTVEDTNDSSINTDEPVFDVTIEWLDDYFGDKRPPIPPNIRLSPEGSEFQTTVWNILLRIPYGNVSTYGAVADAVVRETDMERMSCRAVGGALARNPISLMVPCHRVIGHDGRMTGYSGGIEKKKYLLEHEGVNISRSRICDKPITL